LNKNYNRTRIKATHQSTEEITTTTTNNTITTTTTDLIPENKPERTNQYQTKTTKATKNHHTTDPKNGQALDTMIRLRFQRRKKMMNSKAYVN
jgi:hypothetical protein